MFQAEIVEETEAHVLWPRVLPSEHLAICEIMWKNMVESDRPQMTIQHGAGALHAGSTNTH